jgi:hypothetical protein
MKEKYYAIKIGRVLSYPYFMLGPDGKTPFLFINKADAQAKCPKHAQAVRVFVTTIP